MHARFKSLALMVAICVGACGVAAVARDSNFAEVQRGRYLVYAGDCGACHTDEGGKPFAGGRAVPTPFGTIYASNITPDRETGIGSWTDEQFYHAMHEGRRPNGEHLYPAFPYHWYTRLRRDDVMAIKAYLDSLTPVRQANKAPDLPWPLSWRGAMVGWNALFFKPGAYRPDPAKSPEWNRGAYLVEGLGHCGACHSPKNALGGVKSKDRFHGGQGEGWFATSLTRDPREGLGRWSLDDMVEYLKTGANARARAMGPMAEVVHDSTMHLSEDDLRAMAMYLKDLPGDSGSNGSQTPGHDRDALQRGKLLYVDQCAGCHMEDGEGIRNVFPPIKGSSGLHAHDPSSLARLVLAGAPSARTPAKPEGFAMPAFGAKLSDAQIADLLTYIRASFGNEAGAVSASQVAGVRKKIERTS
ncbi:MAG TPA: cytochrome c [Casimicrobiaceae bacterium]|nr:cytochrome c [Casimicrobiaceae bacterium]